jgi:uncharacterized delta-60 repeat protein
MTILTGIVTAAQQQQFENFSALLDANGISSAGFTEFADGLEFGTLKEILLSTSRYDLEVRSVGNILLGTVSYLGTGFNTTGGIGEPLVLNPSVFGVGAALNTIRLTSAAGYDLLVYKGNISITQMLGSDTTAGSLGLTELQIGSAGLGQMVLVKGNLSLPVNTPNGGLTGGTLSGSITELTVLARQGQEAYQLTVSGSLNPSATFTEQVTGNITSVGDNLTGAITGITFNKLTYSDQNGQTVASTTSLISATGLNLTPQALESLMNAANHPYGPDITFGTNGQINTDIGTNSEDWASAMTVQSGGQIVVAGVVWSADMAQSRIAVTRYNSNGTLDTSFDSDGKWLGDYVAGQSWVPAIFQTSAGKLVFGVNNWSGFPDSFSVICLNANGSLDTSFSGDGLLNQMTIVDNGQAFSPNTLSLQSDGKILVAGWDYVARYTTTGVLDTSFDSDGYKTLAPGGLNIKTVQQFGTEIVVAGISSNGGPTHLELVRMSADGTVLATGTAPIGAEYNGSGPDVPVKVVYDAANDQYVVATFTNNGMGSYSLGIARFNADGSLDVSFGPVGGWAIYSEVANVVGNDVRLENLLGLRIGADGTIMVLGFTDQDTGFLLQLTANGWVMDVSMMSPELYALTAWGMPGDDNFYMAGTGWNGSVDSDDFAVAKIAPSETTFNQIFLSGNDTLTLNVTTNVTLNGYTGNDTITTGSGNDYLIGGAGNDTLSGNAGDDHLNGGVGVDALTGGAGADKYIFDNVASIDTVTGFVAADDTIVLAGSAFTAAGNGPLDASKFKLASQALDADDRVIYDSVTGALYYDADGSVTTIARVQVATLTGAPAVTAADIYVSSNNQPILVTDSATTGENSPVTINIGANDYLPEGWEVGAAWVASGSGTAEINDAGQLVFTPGISYDALKVGDGGTATINYYATDDNAGFVQGTVNVTVNGQNDAPVLTPLNAAESVYQVVVTPNGTYGPADLLEISADRQTIYYADTVNGDNTYRAYSKNLTTGVVTELGHLGTDWTPQVWNTGVTPDLANQNVAREGAGATLEVNLGGQWTYVDHLSFSNPGAYAKPSPFTVSPDGSKVAYIGTDGWNDQTLKIYDFATHQISLVDTSANVGWDIFGATNPLRATEPYFVDNSTIIVQASSLPTTYGGGNLGVISVSLTTGKIPNTTVSEDSQFGYTVAPSSFLDPDGDTLIYTATRSNGAALPSWLHFDATTRTFSGTPTNGDVGTLAVKVTAADPSGASANDTFTLTVQNVNDAPTLTNSIVDRYVVKDVPYTQTLPANVFTDVDAGDSVAFSVTRGDGTALPAWVSYDPATRVLSGTPGAGDTGRLEIKMTGTDQSGAQTSDWFSIYVSSPPTVATPIPDQAVAEDASLSYVMPANTFGDVDGWDATLAYTATRADGTALPSWLSFNATTHTFSGTPQNADVGAIDVTVTATDLAGASISDTFQLTVNNTNDAPTLALALPAKATAEDAAFSWQVPASHFADVDVGDTLTWSALQSSGAALPAWLSFNPATRTFSGTPMNADVGSLTIRVTVTDGSAATASATFNLVVANTNDAPIAADNQTFTVNEDSLLANNVTATDEDLDPLTYRLNTGAGHGLVALNTDGSFNYRPDPNYFGADNFTYRVEDGRGGVDTATVSLTVTAVNDAPVTAGGSLRVVPGETYSGTLTASDVEGDTVSFSTQTGPTQGILSLNADGSYTYTANSDAGSDSFTYQVSDGHGGLATGSIVIEAGTPVDTALVGTAGADILNGRIRNDNLSGLGGNDLLNGFAGNDLLDGGAGNDTLIGGVGDDTYVVDSALDQVIEQSGGGNDTVLAYGNTVLADNVETLILLGGDLDGRGNTQANLIIGSAGANRLDGSAGADTLIGGAGNDTYVIDQVGDLIIEAPGQGSDSVEASFSFSLGSGLENLTLTGGSALDGTGNEADNQITGNSGANHLDGGLGKDSLAGGAGDDTYFIDGNDTVTEDAAEGTDTLYFRLTQPGQSYTLGANLENLILEGTLAGNASGNTGNNTLTGNSAGNVLAGLAGNDWLDGGAGADTLMGGQGNDTYVIDHFADKIKGETASSGTDVVYSSVSYVLPNYVEELRLTGSADINATGNGQSNILVGNLGKNILTGLGGNDVLNGGAGADTLTGGLGNDSFVFGTLDGRADRITDFVLNTDQILFDTTVFTGIAPGLLDAADFVSGAGLSTAQDASDRLIYNSTTGALYYDADGAGGNAAVQVATLSSNPALTANAFGGV